MVFDSYAVALEKNSTIKVNVHHKKLQNVKIYKKKWKKVNL